MNAGRRGSRDRNTVIVSCGKPALQSSQLDVYKSDVVVKQSNATADFGSACAARQKCKPEPRREIVSSNEPLAIVADTRFGLQLGIENNPILHKGTIL